MLKVAELYRLAKQAGHDGIVSLTLEEDGRLWMKGNVAGFSGAQLVHDVLDWAAMHDMQIVVNVVSWPTFEDFDNG